MAIKPREWNVFGVAAFIDAQGTILYTSDYRSRAVGRISDLIAAQLQGTGVDELRLRAVLLLALYQSYAIRGQRLHTTFEAQPCSLEVGLDSQFLAVSVSFHWEEGRAPHFSDLAERINREAYLNPFEEVLGFLRLFCTQLILKYEYKENRLELVMLFDLAESARDSREPFVLSEVKSETTPLLEVKSYIELGDLDSIGLLKSKYEEQSKVVEESETIVGPDEKAIEEEVLLQGSIEAETEETVKGSKDSDLDSTEVNGDEADPEATHRLGGDKPVEKEFNRVVKGGEKKQEKGWNLGWFKKLLGQEDSKNEESPLSQEENLKLSAVNLEHQESEQIAAEFQEETDRLIKDLSESVLLPDNPQIKKVLGEISKSVESDKANRWVESLSTELIQEKARISQLSKDLQQEHRQRLQQFQRLETSLKEEIKRRDALIRRQESSLIHKEQKITQILKDRDVSHAQEAASHASDEYKHKYEQLSKAAGGKDAEIRALNLKMKDLENKLMIAQSKSRSGNETALTARLTNSERKVEELKRLNQRLTESLNAQKERSHDKREEQEHRRKLEVVERQSMDFKKQLDRTAARLKEVQDSERKVQIELGKALEENRKLRQAQSRQKAS